MGRQKIKPDTNESKDKNSSPALQSVEGAPAARVAAVPAEEIAPTTSAGIVRSNPSAMTTSATTTRMEGNPSHLLSTLLAAASAAKAPTSSLFGVAPQQMSSATAADVLSAAAAVQQLQSTSSTEHSKNGMFDALRWSSALQQAASAGMVPQSMQLPAMWGPFAAQSSNALSLLAGPPHGSFQSSGVANPLAQADADVLQALHRRAALETLMVAAATQQQQQTHRQQHHQQQQSQTVGQQQRNAPGFRGLQF